MVKPIGLPICCCNAHDPLLSVCLRVVTPGTGGRFCAGQSNVRTKALRYLEIYRSLSIWLTGRSRTTHSRKCSADATWCAEHIHAQLYQASDRRRAVQPHSDRDASPNSEAGRPRTVGCASPSAASSASTAAGRPAACATAPSMARCGVHRIVVGIKRKNLLYATRQS